MVRRHSHRTFVRFARAFGCGCFDSCPMRCFVGGSQYAGGFHFPDTAGEYKNIDSKILLRDTVKMIRDKGYQIGNADITVCAERPKLNPHIPAMKKCLAEVMAVDEEDISIKATTTEKLGFTGREEGISAYAMVLLQK